MLTCAFDTYACPSWLAVNQTQRMHFSMPYINLLKFVSVQSGVAVVKWSNFSLLTLFIMRAHVLVVNLR
jgi:hypothetical protein